MKVNIAKHSLHKKNYYLLSLGFQFKSLLESEKNRCAAQLRLSNRWNTIILGILGNLDILGIIIITYLPARF